MDRRAFLRLSAGTLTAAVLGPRRLHAATVGGEALYASCVKLPNDSYAVAIMSESGAIQFLRPLPDRGHDVAFDPVSRRCVAFARRPGTFAVVVDLDGRTEPVVLSAAPGRHFYGHGVFTADGSILYATENDFEAAGGVVGIYDAKADFRRIGEFSTGGVGPHELVWLPDGRTLAVANGGLDTHPDFGRVALNSAEMQPSLSLLEAESGRLLATETLDRDLAALSIRHLAVDAAGAVWFGCQYEGDPMDLPPLAGRLVPGRRAELFSLPDELQAGARNYVGSVAASADGELVAFSAPRGGIVFAFEARSARFAGKVEFNDGCGIAPAPVRGPSLLATSGTGRIATVERSSGLAITPVGRDDLAFDNHLNLLA
ncbi:DUF1513 domain-containing protein [Chthonobacter albigriseus]|uniref:DUF1513 domain-containing protein n=1 Tax=Chthonobacter albigriseus TaxID=1683161 RepID=UPI0015EF1DA9|nr:DUF1513 domain-containing protein [Chthonobacter albigriseus]